MRETRCHLRKSSGTETRGDTGDASSKNGGAAGLVQKDPHPSPVYNVSFTDCRLAVTWKLLACLFSALFVAMTTWFRLTFTLRFPHVKLHPLTLAECAGTLRWRREGATASTFVDHVNTLTRGGVSLA